MDGDIVNHVLTEYSASGPVLELYKVAYTSRGAISLL